MEIPDHTLTHSSSTTWIPFLLLAGISILYLFAMLRQHPSGRIWNVWRTVSFMTGIVLLALAMWPSVVHYAHIDLRYHMIQHLLMGMLAPLGLVLGAPVTLALKTLPARKARIITAILGSRPFHYLGHPVTACILNIGGMYLLYLTPLYVVMLHHPHLHLLVHIHFLAAGYLFIWAIAGPDPAPRRPGLHLRLIVLLIGTAAHAYLSKLMYAYSFPRDSPHSLEEIQVAAKIMYYGGDLAELLLAIAFFSIWYSTRGRRTLNFRPA